jgi:hypothetical protein
MANRVGVILDTAARGTNYNKTKPIDSKAKLKKMIAQGERAMKDTKHILDETETTMRFGMFMLTLHYFRAMAFVMREQKTWSGEGDELAGDSKKRKESQERMKMKDEALRFKIRKEKNDRTIAKTKAGQLAILTRKMAIRKEFIVKLALSKRKSMNENDMCTRIQRVVRGHRGRKHALIWALKKAEIGALNHLLNLTATKIQAQYRGYLARVLTTETRMIMAQFMAELRARDAASDETEYWKTHPYSRFKRDTKKWINNNLKPKHAHMIAGGSRLTEQETKAYNDHMQSYTEGEDNIVSDDETPTNTPRKVKVKTREEQDEEIPDEVIFEDDDYVIN